MEINLGIISFELTTWIAIGFLGQLFFTSRFLIQWIASEKAKRSIVPLAFWYFSLFGGTTLFIYAVHRQDPVFMLGQGMGLFIYMRNLYLIYKEKTKQQKEATSTSSDEK
ncbi:MAG: lipid A biosynthesis protein [Alphaproteobacteria bacterium]|nr:lipid A biosynthesis protein [Alphaproteobacteria bacterium]